MAGEQRVSEILLKYNVDQGSQRQVIQSIEAVERSFADVRDELGDLNPVSRAAVSSLTTDFRLADDRAVELRRTIDDVRDSLERLDDVRPDLNTRLASADEQFDLLSRNVGLAGDAQSNLGALRGIADLTGAGGLGQVENAALVQATDSKPRQ